MSVNIHGKEYVTVDERVAEFHKLYPNGSITTELVEFTDKRVITKTLVIPDVDKPERFFTGLAYEMVGIGNINKTSSLENCETSSTGRALGMLNIGLVGSLATADEVDVAIKTQDAIKVTEQQKDKYQQLLAHKCFKGKKKVTNDWWAKIYDTANPNASAEKCLKQMENAIELFENPEPEKDKKEGVK